MGTKHNPFTGFLQKYFEGGVTFKAGVADVGNLPSSGNSTNDGRIVSSNHHLYIWNGSSWVDQGDLLDITWSALTGKPSSTPTQIDDAVSDVSDLKDGAIEFVIDGGGSAITTGVKGFLEVPFDCTIQEVRILADQTGSIKIDIWKDTYANYPPTDADSITAGNEPEISSGTKYQDAVASGWNTSLSEGDILGFNVDSVSTIERVTVILEVVRS